MLQRPISDTLKAEVLDIAPVIIAIHDTDHNIWWANKAYQEATGITLQEIAGKKCYSVWQLARPCRGCPVTTAIETGEQQEAELTPQNQDHWPSSQGSWLSRAAPFRDSDGNIIGVVETAYNITDRILAEEALNKLNEELENTIQQRTAELAEKEATLMDAFNFSPIGKALVSPDGRFLRVNAALCSILGYSVEELLVKTFQEITHPEYLQADLDYVKQMLNGEIETYEMEKIYLHKQGPHVWAQLNVSLVRDKIGQPLFFIAQIQDITKRKQTKIDLRESEQRFALLTTQLDSAIWIATGDGSQILDVNHAFEKVYGIPARELRTNPGIWLEMIHPDDRKIAEDSQEELFRSGQSQAVYRIVKPDGETRWINERKAMVYDDEGQPIQIGGIAGDITESKNSELENEKLQAQFRQAQKMEAVGRLAGGVAHDYNNMLTVITGYTELALLSANPDEPIHTHLTEILTAAKRSTDLTKQLLGFARQQTTSPKVLDLNRAVESTLKMIKPLIGEDIDLAWFPGAELWPVKIDPTQLDQILANICINARDAIVGNGKVTIETKNFVFDENYCADHMGFVPGEFSMIAISDDGSGMDKETLDRIFEPFFTTKKVGRGTGLGLASVYGTIKQNNGFINVYSEPGKGTTFHLYLPRHTDPTVVPQKERAVKTIEGHGETLLVVEDEISILKLIKEMLEKLGYNVLTANTPSDAIRLAEEHDDVIHLLLTDVVMPEMNGKELVEQLQSCYPDLNYLFMSGYTANVIAHHGILDEGVHFIQKPISRKELAVKIREALAKSGVQPEKTLGN